MYTHAKDLFVQNITFPRIAIFPKTHAASGTPVVSVRPMAQKQIWPSSCIYTKILCQPQKCFARPTHILHWRSLCWWLTWKLPWLHRGRDHAKVTLSDCLWHQLRPYPLLSRLAWNFSSMISFNLNGSMISTSWKSSPKLGPLYFTRWSVLQLHLVTVKQRAAVHSWD